MFTKKLPGLWDISYPERLQLLNLQSLEYRRISQDLMLCYQIVHGRCDITIASCFVHRSNDSTRGNQLKLYKCHCTVDVTKLRWPIPATVKNFLSRYYEIVNS